MYTLTRRPMALFALIAILYGPFLSAQFTLTDDYFPVAGDSLLTAQAPDELLDSIQFQSPGADLTWDFGYPATHTSFSQYIEGFSSDTLFPRADSRHNSAAFDFEYLQHTDTALNLVGLVGRLPLFRELPLSTTLSPPRPLRRAGITYGDRFETTSVRESTIAIVDLPEEILEGDVGTTLKSFDSLRIISTSVRTDEVDAWGTLRLEGSDYSVLREKRIEQIDTRLELKREGGNFADVTSLLLLSDPTYASYLGQQPSEGTYYFWSPTSKEAVVEIEFDEAEKPKTFLFKRNGTGDLTATTTLLELPLGVSPNPVVDRFTVDYHLPSAGAVRAALFTADGRQLKAWSLGRQARGALRFEGAVGDLPAGVYLLRLRTANGVGVARVVKG